MIKVVEKIWVGGYRAWENIYPLKIDAVLCVAQDMKAPCGWPDVVYMQVGLVDGPGNPASAYVAAVLALVTLVEKHSVLVCCHGGSRSMATVIMYMATVSSIGWDNAVEILKERANVDLPEPHLAHRAAFDNIKHWRAIRDIMEKQ